MVTRGREAGKEAMAAIWARDDSDQGLGHDGKERYLPGQINKIGW